MLCKCDLVFILKDNQVVIFTGSLKTKSSEIAMNYCIYFIAANTYFNQNGKDNPTYAPIYKLIFIQSDTLDCNLGPLTATLDRSYDLAVQKEPIMLKKMSSDTIKMSFKKARVTAYTIKYRNKQNRNI